MEEQRVSWRRTISMNPQFVIKLNEVDDDRDDGEEGCSLIVCLMQKNRHKYQPRWVIGFSIYKLPEEYSGKKQVHLKRDFFESNRSVAHTENFINSREVCGRFCLPPGEYLIIPSTFNPNEEADFYMRVFSEKGADFQEIDDPVDCHVEEVNNIP